MKRLGFLALCPALAAAAPVDLAWQGRLLATDGTPLSGTHTLRLRLYDDALSFLPGDTLKDQTFTNVPVDQGFVSLRLTGVDSAHLTGDVWVGVTVDGGAELAPRDQIVFAPKAAYSAVTEAVRVEGAASGGCTTTGAIRFDTSLNSLRVCNGTQWVTIGAGGSSSSTTSATAAWSFTNGYADDSGHNVTLSPSGGASTAVAGATGNGLSLDGVSGTRASVASVVGLGGDQPLTTAVWFKADTVASVGAGRGLIAVGGTGARAHFYLRAWAGNAGYVGCDQVTVRLNLGADDGATDQWHCGTTTLQANVWYHAAATYDPTTRTVKLYLNGNLERTSVLSQALSLGSGVQLGGDLYNDNSFDGTLDDAVIYPTVKDATEIAAMYQAGLPGLMSNADFEGGAVGWTATGTAFTGWPHSSCNNAGACFGTKGITSLAGGETATGTLTSTVFKIRQRYLCWKSGGGNSSYTGVDLDANGTYDLTMTAFGTEGNSPSFDSWHDQCMDLNAHIGKLARVQLVDNDSGSSFGWAAWDSFQARDTPL
jgi:hypothetical protein